MQTPISDPHHGIRRRELLQVGGLASLGLSLPGVLKAAENNSGGTAKAVILINLIGGPSHIDMFDMKPNAPLEIRGEFRPIATKVPGLQVCEHMPRTAKVMHHSTVIRTHSHLYNTHSPYNMLTGYSGPVIVDNVAKRTDHPCVGSVMRYLGRESRDVPSFVWMPAHPGHSQSKHRAGPYGGFLGRAYDPLFTTYDPKFEETKSGRNARINPPTPTATPRLDSVDTLPGLSLTRLSRRGELLKKLDGARSRLDNAGDVRTLSRHQRKALQILTSKKTRNAFDLSRESKSVREKYGRNIFGSCLLTARRLVEAGAKFVGVTTESQLDGKVGAGQWDTHSNNFNLLRNFNLPVLDRYYPALIEDLAERGLLDSTLVVLMGEMGRTPKVNRNAGGRDHWTQCGFIVLTGGGARKGAIVGQSDKYAAWPVDRPVSSADHVATIYHLLGINPHQKITDAAGQSVSLALHGEPVWEAIEKRATH